MSALLLRSAVRSSSNDLACPSCRLRFIISSLQAARSGHAFKQQTRFASLASATAINASKNIPSRLKPLHTSLEKLRTAASSYVNLSRLQLALKSLESDEPTIRVAILGLGAQNTARRLTRLLVADPLIEEQPWEREIKSMQEDDPRSVLLQYGPDGQPAPTNPLLHTLSVPSPLLKSHNLEILTSPIVLAGASTGVDAESLKDAALVPMATTPRSFSGSNSFVRYPVHRALIVAHGVQGCMMLGKQDVDIMRHTESVRAAIDLPVSNDQPADVAVINVEEAEMALDAFRQNISNATFFEKEWFSSGLPVLTTWLSQTQSSDLATALPPPVRNLIDDTLHEASSNILKEEESRLSLLTSSTAVPMDIREPLDDSVRFWAMRAHTELRDELESAFTSHNWTKLKWWKLLWRVDDVSMFLSDVLDRSWLVDAEKRLVWLIGRCTQAGIYDQHEAELRLHGTSAADPTPNASLPTTSSVQPIPLQIPETRQALRTTTIPSLQGLAQSLVLQTASFIGAGIGVSGVIYSLLPAAGIYESGAVAALVFIWALRRVQRRWEGSKTTWQGELQERGRIALQTTERLLRDAIKGTNRTSPKMDVEGASDRKAAREVVNAAEQALSALDK